MKYIFIMLAFVATASFANDELQTVDELQTIAIEPLKEENTIPASDSIISDIQQQEFSNQVKPSTWIAVGFDALGVVAIGFGVWQNSKANKLYKNYKRLYKEDDDYKGAQEKVENAVTKRNVAYIISGTLLTAGIGVHIWF